MNHCKNCKYFISGEDIDNFDFEDFADSKDFFMHTPSPVGTFCLCPKWMFGYGISKEKIKDDNIVVEFDELWGCRPGPLFGCIHWESKEAK